jgi:hypothetical protein
MAPRMPHQTESLVQLQERIPPVEGHCTNLDGVIPHYTSVLFNIRILYLFMFAYLNVLKCCLFPVLPGTNRVLILIHQTLMCILL